MYHLLDLTPQILETHYEYFLHLENYFLPKIRWDKNNFLVNLERKWILSKAIVLEKQIIGYLIVSQKNSDCCHLHRFVIDKNFRHKGLGSRIIHSYCSFLSNHAKFLTLKIHRTENFYENFYKKNNFFNIFLIEDHYLLIRAL